MKTLLLSLSILVITFGGVSISRSIQESTQLRKNQEVLADTLEQEARLLAAHEDLACMGEVVRSYLIFRGEPNLSTSARAAMLDAKSKYPALFDKSVQALSSRDQAVIAAS